MPISWGSKNAIRLKFEQRYRLSSGESLRDYREVRPIIEDIERRQIIQYEVYNAG